MARGTATVQAARARPFADRKSDIFYVVFLSLVIFLAFGKFDFPYLMATILQTRNCDLEISEA